MNPRYFFSYYIHLRVNGQKFVKVENGMVDDGRHPLQVAEDWVKKNDVESVVIIQWQEVTDEEIEINRTTDTGGGIYLSP